MASNLKQLIYEAVKKGMAFNLDTFRQLPTYDERWSYLKSTSAKLLGVGLSRQVFDIGGGLVLKVEPPRVVKQNVHEVEASKCAGSNAPIARVAEHGKDLSWLVMEKADSVFKDDVPLIAQQNKALGFPTSIALTTDYDFEELVTKVLDIEQMNPEFQQSELNHLLSGNDAKMGKQIVWLRDHPNTWFRGLVEFVEGCQINEKDLGYQNWGMKNGVLVLVDYGFK